MKEFINNIKNVISAEMLIYILIAVVLLVILSILMMALRQKKARKKLEDLELHYNSLKSVPLAFKLNKAVALSRVNEMMAETVETCRNDFDNIQEELKECSVSLAEIDDLIYVHKVKGALKKMSSMEQSIALLDTKIQGVNNTLDEVLEQESEQRASINELKERFRKVKRAINENKASFSQSYEHMETEVASVEKMFSVFEEWMFASEFNKAADQQNEIRDVLQHLEELTQSLPQLYEKAKGLLPRMIDEVGFHYAQVKNKGVYIEHLEIRKNLDVISEMLKNNLTKLRNGNPKGVDEDLLECEKRINQLEEQISKEEKAFDEINENVDLLFDDVKEINHDIEEISKLYKRVYERFGFENWSEKLADVADKLAVLNDMQRKLDKVIVDKGIPYTTILVAYHELEQSITAFRKEVSDMKEKLNKACSDEERAKKQMVKLQLILNEIRVKMSKHRLPNVSQKYKDDLHKGEDMLKDMQIVLDHSPLDVKQLNGLLKTAIDYIYTLYNDVNNLVGMAIMVENTIVFGNRYRSTYADIDSELTRAELCFRNGQYTKALKIGIQCIEKIHPGAYEKMMEKHSQEQLKVEE